MLPFSRPSCYFKTRPPYCALGTSFYTVLEGRDLMTYVSDNYTSYSAPSPLSKTAMVLQLLDICSSAFIFLCIVILSNSSPLIILCGLLVTSANFSFSLENFIHL